MWYVQISFLGKKEKGKKRRKKDRNTVMLLLSPTLPFLMFQTSVSIFYIAHPASCALLSLWFYSFLAIFSRPVCVIFPRTTVAVYLSSTASWAGMLARIEWMCSAVQLPWLNGSQWMHLAKAAVRWWGSLGHEAAMFFFPPDWKCGNKPKHISHTGRCGGLVGC